MEDKKFILELEHKFDSAHSLNLDYESPCQRTHGHTWSIIVKIATTELNKNGMIIDFKEIKKLINQLDHVNLNDFIEQPTAENLACYFYEEIKNKLLENISTEVSVRIFESLNASITYGETIN